MGRKEDPLETAAMPDPTEPIADLIQREQGKLRNFIRKWLPEEADVEDVLQDVFYELVEAQRLVTPLRQTAAWMYRVARNRITDLFRRRSAERRRAPAWDDPEASLEELLPAPGTSPESAYARRVLLEELELALEELPPEQREAFIAHEIEGLSFKELAAATGLPVNTLISRKHYAVLHLRQRLRTIYEEYDHV